MSEVYPPGWHRFYGDKTFRSAGEIMRHVTSIFDIGSTVEVGCGNAHWTRAALDLGVEAYAVADGPWNNRADLLVDKARFVEIDLGREVRFERRFDLAICLEVAEHVARDHADNVVETLTSAADVILFGAAIPYQGGFGHINEQWPSWWRDKFEARGYVPYDLVRPKFWEDASLHYWYRQNAFIYVKSDAEEPTQRARDAEAQLYRRPAMFDAVIPEKFEEVASYKAIALKRLLRRLPGWAAMRVRNKVARS